MQTPMIIPKKSLFILNAALKQRSIMYPTNRNEIKNSQQFYAGFVVNFFFLQSAMSLCTSENSIT